MRTWVIIVLLMGLGSAASAQNLEELFQAVQEYRPQVATQLLAARPELAKEQDRRGHTALLRAAYLRRADLANLLIAKGSDVNAGSLRGTRPLHAAAFAGSSEIVTLLLANGADTNLRDGGGRVALHWAAWKGYAEIVTRLLQVNGSVVGSLDAYGSTPLHLAARAGMAEVVAQLLAAGADREMPDGRGKTALMLCREGKHRDWQKVEALLAPK